VKRFSFYHPRETQTFGLSNPKNFGLGDVPAGLRLLASKAPRPKVCDFQALAVFSASVALSGIKVEDGPGRI